MGIPFKESIPLYYQVESYLRFQIESGNLAPNTKLPPEKEFCRENGVSQGTLRKAFERLEGEGLIIRRAGKGTFIAPRREQGYFPIEMRLVGFLEDLILYGKKTEVEILGMSSVSASGEMAGFFGVKEGEKVPQFKRLKTIKGYPLYYVVNHIVPDIGNEIRREDLLRMPPLELFEKKFRRSVEYIEQRIEAIKADQEVAKVLGLNIFEPILHIHLAVFEKGRRPLEIADLFCRGDRYRFVAELTKRRPFKTRL